MTLKQAARGHCCNYQPDGSCLGLAFRDDLSMYRFRKEGLPCVFLQQPCCERCPFFEQTVLPQVPTSVAQQYHNSLPSSVPIGGQAQRSAKKVCIDCRKREVRPRQKYCVVCAKVRKRLANRHHISRKRGHHVEKFSDSPLGVEALTSAENQIGYIYPESSISGVFPQGDREHVRREAQ